VVSLYELLGSRAAPRLKIVTNDISEWSGDDRRYLHRALAGIERLGTMYSVDSEEVAWQEVISLISRTMLHASPQKRLTNFKDWLESEARSRDATPADEMR